MSTNPLSIQQINRFVGNIDLYLLDQILKDRFDATKPLLDAGCGEGRNLTYFINAGYEAYGIDRQADALRMLGFIARQLSPGYPADRFQAASVEQLPYPDAHFGTVVCSAVLHFAESEEHFWTMCEELNRVLAPGGVIFIRMASIMGLDLETKPEDNGRHWLPDGSIRFLLTREHWNTWQSKFDWEPVDHLKVVSVDQQRGMATAVLRKKG